MPAKSLLFLLLCFTSLAQTKKQEVALNPINLADYPFYTAAFETVNGQRVYSQNFKHLDSVNIYSFTYKSFDGLNITGFMAAPAKPGKYPVVIYNRGGNGNYGTVTGNFMATFLARIANKGYVVIGSQLRGGGGKSEGADEFGGKDVNDALSLLEVIDGFPNADNSKIATIGWSRGVMTSFLMLKKTNRIKTNIAIAGPADLLASRPEMFKVYKARIPNYEIDSVAVLKQRSPLFAIDSIQNKKLSNLIIHGRADTRIDVKDATQLYKKLAENHFAAQLVLYNDEDHDLANVRQPLLKEIYQWLAKKLN